MEIKVTKKHLKTGWIEGYLQDGEDRYKFRAQVYGEDSVYGIDNGRVSKLIVCTIDGSKVVEYERLWVIEPTTQERQTIVGVIVNKLERD